MPLQRVTANVALCKRDMRQATDASWHYFSALIDTVQRNRYASR